jgi:dTDP-glucose 4,6-dehydratase
MDAKGTALVTGGAGFLGSWLCESLLGKGYRVMCLDNLSTGRRDNVGHLKGLVLIEHDATIPFHAEGRVDYVFHLGSPASPKDFSRIPVEIMMANSLGTYNMLCLAREKGARFLLASTSEAYGDPEQHPQPEGYWGHVNPVGPRSCYDESKRFAEALAMAFHRVHGMDVRIARIFNTYGPRMRRDDGRAVPNFVSQALEGRDITVYGDGRQTRSFCYVTDLVEGLQAVMLMEGLSGQVFNVGNPDEFAIAEVARMVKELAGSRSEIVFSDLPEDDPSRRKPDITRVTEATGWSPRVGLRQGLQRTIESFRQY